MEITYKVSPTFARFHADENKYKCIMGPVGAGKSSGCIMDLFLNAIKQKPDENGVRHSRYCVVRSTYPKLRSSTIKTFIEWFKDKITIVYTTPIVGRLKYDLADGTSIDMEILFVAIEDEAAAEGLRSWEFTGFWVNEAHEVPEYLVKVMCVQRFNRFPSERSGGPVCPQIILDYNAVPTDHWLYKWAEEEKPEGVSFYKQPPAAFIDEKGNYHVNPEAENLEFLPPDYYENILKISPPEVINTDVLNNYGERKAGKPVYKDFSDKEHTAPAPIMPPNGLHVVIGLDQGLSPAAAFTFQSLEGTLVVFDEITTEDCSLKEFAEDLLIPHINAKYPWIKGNYSCVIDPAAAQRSMNDAKAGYEILKEAGLPVRMAKSNSPTERREAVIHFLLKKEKFKLSPECHALRRGFISDYRYEEKRSVGGRQFKDKPLKNEYSHVHDALQYAAMEYIGRKKKRFNSMSSKKYTVASSVGGY